MNEIPGRVDHLPNDYMPLANSDSVRESVSKTEIVFVSIEADSFPKQRKIFYLFMVMCLCCA